MISGIIAWIFQIVLLWIGIVIAGMLATKSITGIGKRAIVIFLTAISIPAYVAFEISDFGQGIHKRFETSAYDREKRAFKSYCIGRTNSFRRRAAEDVSSVKITFSGKDKFGLPASLYAGELAEEFVIRTKTAKKLCSSSRLEYLEGTHVFLDGQYRFHLCPRTVVEGKVGAVPSYGTEKIEMPVATHELRFGPQFDQAPNPVFSARGFAKMQVQVVDSRFQEVLAEDTLFFLGPIIDGNHVCPNGYAQLHELLTKVFERPSANPTVNTDAAR